MHERRCGLTSGASKHDEEYWVEEAERHREDVLVEHGGQQEHTDERQRTLPTSQQLDIHSTTAHQLQCTPSTYVHTQQNTQLQCTPSTYVHTQQNTQLQCTPSTYVHTQQEHTASVYTQYVCTHPAGTHSFSVHLVRMYTPSRNTQLQCTPSTYVHTQQNTPLQCTPSTYVHTQQEHTDERRRTLQLSLASLRGR